MRREVVDERVLVVTIDRPEARNAFTAGMALQMESIVDDFEADDDLWLLLITGAGPTFCAGQDLKEAAAGTYAWGKTRGGFGILERPPLKPVIVAVEGHAFAGGFELALCADLIVATTVTQFALSEVKRGLIAAGGGLMRLPRRLPYHLAMEIALTGEPQTAQAMQAHGIVSRLAEPGKAFDVALELASLVLANGPMAVAASKDLIARGAGEQWSEAEGWSALAPAFARVRASDDCREGLAAFAEKRAPVWRNR
ncbi:MAG TPA: crotonase/enoyl-CoA hydratase family protein [Phenylobacterium sp.]